MLSGASDCRFLRKAGIPTYGVSGLFYDLDDIRLHGKDERVSLRQHDEGVEFTYRLVKRLAGGK